MAKSQNPKSPSTTANKVTLPKGPFYATVEFRDINDFGKIYAAGSNVSHLETDRLTRLMELGYISAGEQVSEKDQANAGNEGDENKDEFQQ
jgi:hypothetical protein